LRLLLRHTPRDTTFLLEFQYNLVAQFETPQVGWRVQYIELKRLNCHLA
jgi:hypothetical protein